MHGSAQAARMAEHFRHFLDLLDGEGRIGQGLHGDGHELHGVVVGGHAVGGYPPADAAPVNDGPLPALADPHGDGLHLSAAVGLAVTRLDVQVKGGQAVGAVVAVVAAGASRYHQSAAVSAGFSEVVARDAKAHKHMAVSIIFFMVRSISK